MSPANALLVLCIVCGVLCVTVPSLPRAVHLALLAAAWAALLGAAACAVSERK